MMDKHKAYDQTPGPRSGRPPLPSDVEIVRKQKPLSSWRKMKAWKRMKAQRRQEAALNPRIIPAVNARWSNKNPNSTMREMMMRPTPQP